MDSDAVSSKVVRKRLDLSQYAHRQLIGYLGLLLPVLLYFVSGDRPTPPLAQWTVLSSVSSYYYTGAVGIFEGVLFALFLFLVTYQGYEGEKADRWVGRIGGAGALGVVMFPTGAPAGLPDLPWWSCGFQIAHYASATILFSSFAVFALWLFPKSDAAKDTPQEPDKRNRNRIYTVCGAAILIGMAWCLIAWTVKKDIFIPETIAIEAFAISWLAKGKADQTIRGTFRRLSSRSGSPRGDGRTTPA